MCLNGIFVVICFYVLASQVCSFDCNTYFRGYFSSDLYVGYCLSVFFSSVVGLVANFA
ncbi:hypothetical protein M758_7G064400 [Ceratodon purpureus]|nr:hypothetical protein M758_7G064400 [Ceratodon purpureus]